MLNRPGQGKLYAWIPGPADLKEKGGALRFALSSKTRTLLILICAPKLLMDSEIALGVRYLR